MKMILAMTPAIALVVYSQLITKWRVAELVTGLNEQTDRWTRLTLYLKDPYILSSYATALVASVAWMFVIERYEISIAFPIYVGLTVLAVVVGGWLLFAEPLSPQRIAAILLIVAGVAIGSRS